MEKQFKLNKKSIGFFSLFNWMKQKNNRWFFIEA
jgi:hypothetical protein